MPWVCLAQNRVRSPAAMPARYSGCRCFWHSPRRRLRRRRCRRRRTSSSQPMASAKDGLFRRPATLPAPARACVTRATSVARRRSCSTRPTIVRPAAQPSSRRPTSSPTRPSAPPLTVAPQQLACTNSTQTPLPHPTCLPTPCPVLTHAAPLHGRLVALPVRGRLPGCQPHLRLRRVLRLQQQLGQPRHLHARRLLADWLRKLEQTLLHAHLCVAPSHSPAAAAATDAAAVASCSPSTAAQGVRVPNCGVGHVRLGGRRVHFFEPGRVHRRRRGALHRVEMEHGL